MKKNWSLAPLRWALSLLVLATTACAPMVPDLSSSDAAPASTVSASTVVADTAPPTTSLAPPSTDPPTTTTTTTLEPTSTTSTTSQPPTPPAVTVGVWTATADLRDAGGEQFVALLTVPVLSASIDQGLLARVTTLVEGHVQSQIGATLALWRSIEGQGERDLTGSMLTLRYEVAAFEDELISIRFFSDEQVAGSGGAKRQVTTLMVDLLSGTAIGLDDVIFSGESRAELLGLVADGLLNDYFNGDEEEFGLWAGSLEVGDLNRAVLTPTGLEIWFDELEVGPPDIGVPVVTIPYELLGDILDPSGPSAVFN